LSAIVIPRAPVVPIEGYGGPPAIVGIDFDQVPWPKHPTVLQVCQAYVQEHVLPSGSDPRRAAYALKKWLESMDYDFLRDASTIKRADGRTFIDHRRAQGVGNAAIRRELSVFRAALYHAKKEERLDNVPRFQAPPESPARSDFLTREQYQRLILVPKKERLQRFLLLAFNTGARARAIETLKWSQVDMVRRVIDYREPGRVYKNKRRAVVPINERLYRRMENWYARRGESEYVIGLSACGKTATTYHSIVPLYQHIGIRPRAPRHVARHTFASWLLQGDPERGIAPTPIHIVAELMADDVKMVQRTYSHILVDQLGSVVDRL